MIGTVRRLLYREVPVMMKAAGRIGPAQKQQALFEQPPESGPPRGTGREACSRYGGDSHRPHIWEASDQCRIPKRHSSRVAFRASASKTAPNCMHLTA